MTSPFPPRGTRQSFGCLWLTDLHHGQQVQKWLWPFHRESFLDDLPRLHRLSGPWDVIAFTGDLVYSGSPDDFASLTSVLNRITEVVARLQDVKPVFLSIPGNHDLKRPDGSTAVAGALRHWWDDEAIRESFWKSPSSDYRRSIAEAFGAYSSWDESHGLPKPPDYRRGLLPGDFSATIVKGDARLGIVGLNSTFLQLSGGDFQGRLDLDPRQLASACGEDHASWIRGNEANILLTHQPLDWLHPTARERFRGAIYPTKSFVAHFFGHMHEHAATVVSEGMGSARRHFQGCSLFGLERYGEAFDKERFKFGYAAFRLEIDRDQGRLYLWPRKAHKQQSGDWCLVPDVDITLEEGTEHTPAQNVPLFGSSRSEPVPVPRATSEPVETPDDVAAALYILQRCGGHLPSEVLLAAARTTPERAWQFLGARFDAAALRDRHEYVLTDGVSSRDERCDSDDLLARTLEALLGYIGQHKSDGHGAAYAGAAITLAKKCKDTRPQPVCGLFNALDRILKRLGDKNTVFEAANLSIDAARRPLRTEEDVQVEAKALICGRSWVFQRVGHLDEALADATKSLELGEKIGWERNTAFCKKCLGRIYRLLAIKETDPARRKELLGKSIASLKDAVNTFRRMEKFGPDHPEVGDCYSLAARTFLVAGQLPDARTYLNKAAERLMDVTDKDYLDYSILEGDYAVAKGDYAVAEQHYRTVIESTDTGDSEKSEIRARALYQRGLARAQRKQGAAAAADFEMAAGIWDIMKERKAAAEARWQKILVEGKLSPKSILQLERSGVTERVIAVQLHETKLAALSGKNPRRSEPDRRYWDQVRHEAREQDAKQDIGW